MKKSIRDRRSYIILENIYDLAKDSGLKHDKCADLVNSFLNQMIINRCYRYKWQLYYLVESAHKLIEDKENNWCRMDQTLKEICIGVKNGKM